MADFIPVDLTEEPKPLPCNTNNIACKGVFLKDANGEKTEDLKKTEKVTLQIEALDCDSPEYEGCDPTFFTSFKLPVGDIDAQTKKGRIFRSKNFCDGFGVEYTSKGFNPYDFEGKATKAVIGQFVLDDGGVINTIDKFL